MDNVNKTLYIPLYGKACVSKRGLFLIDKKAEEIWAAEAFALRGKSKSRWLAYYMGIRAAVFDQWVKEQTAALKDAVVLHIGCGMDSRVLRAGEGSLMWYDVDFPAVIKERKRYYSDSPGYKMIAGDVREEKWLEAIPEKNCAIVVMEGLSMYLSPEELHTLANNLCAHFDKISLLMDCYSLLAARMSKYKNPINDVGVTKVYGMDAPELLEKAGLVYIKEHPMTPQRYVDELSGPDKYIFEKLYGGSLSRKLYRLYEYKKL